MRALAALLGLTIVAAGAAVFAGGARPGGAPLRAEAAVDPGFPDEYPSLLVTNPKLLAGLEGRGYAFADVMGARGSNREGAPREDYADESAKLVAERSPLYDQLAHEIERDLAVVAQTTPKSGASAEFVHRLFDAQWLRSERIHFELVGVVNRVDFRLLVGAGCGQTRLVYRMAISPYGRPVSRLPMTVNVVYENRQASCAPLAGEWLSLDDGAGDLGARLRAGPLAELRGRAPDHVEIDLQSMRENAARDGMDDHAEYLLRSFDAEGDRLRAAPLRNTPDPGASRVTRESIRQWALENVDGIEAGAAELPASLAATRATSVSPRSLSRPGNRPYKSLFPDEAAAFGAHSFAKGKLVTSPAALVRRLDEMSCVGCHQSRSVAGFHLLGDERTSARGNALVLGFSQHLREMLPWRHRFLEAAARGQVLDEPLPFAERPDDDGKYGAHCNTSEAAPAWACGRELACANGLVQEAPTGMCLPSSGRHVGDPCETVALGAPEGPDGDPVKVTERAACAPIAGASGGSYCNSYRTGFPGGMCTARCTEEGQRLPEGMCVRIPHTGHERECFKEGKVFEECMLRPGNTALEVLRTCSRTNACRDEYACARTPFLPEDQGACVPPYFLFETRVDGPPADR